LKDLEWFRPDGVAMAPEDWGVAYAKTLGAFVNGNAISERTPTGRRITDDSFFLMFNSYEKPMEFKLPPKKWGAAWKIVVDTADVKPPDGAKSYAFEQLVHVAGHAMVVLRRVVA
jgi:isoamylase